MNLSQVLKDCKKSASVGYKLASSQFNDLQSTLYDASEKINSTLMDFNSSPCYVSSATDLLSQQLIDIEAAINNLSFAFKEDLQNLKENLSKFSITLFGKTMAGKSTLMEILTEGDGKSIGLGAQRTTRDVRKYTWNNLEITDVPGIGAFEGEEDEQIAFEAAKTADLILFLLTDDAPQAIEAKSFGRIMDLGKPIICIVNVKVSVSDNKSIKLITRDIEKRFDMNRLNEIRNQFLSYSNQFGQNWGAVPFVYVHLKSAFLAQNNPNQEEATVLYNISRIGYLKSKLIEQVRNKGEFYRIKTFIDIISNPMINAMESLLNQSIINSTQGRTVLSKKRQMIKWKIQFKSAGESRIHSLIINLKSQLNGEIATFAEEHFSDKNADIEWNNLLRERRIQDQCQNLLQELEEQCNDKLKEIAREITNELNFTASFAGDRTLKMNKIIDVKRVWDWSATLAGGGLSIAAIIAGVLGASVAGPLGWAAIAVAAIGTVGSLALKSRDKKEQEARIRLENNLRKNVDSICKSLENQMLKSFSLLISTHIESLLKELDRVNSVVFRLADTQKELAWNLDRHLLELNRQIVKEAIHLIDADDLEYNIESVARIPGNAVVIMLRDRSSFPEEQRKRLHDLTGEYISFIYNSYSKRVLISRVLGKTIERNQIKIEEKIGVAHIPLKDAPPHLLTKVRIAQQFAKIAITE